MVEKCLLVLKDEHRSRIIHELLSSSHFEQLLQDPHANYVIQTALRVSEVWNFYHSVGFYVHDFSLKIFNNASAFFNLKSKPTNSF